MQSSRRAFLDGFLSYVGDAGDATSRDRAETLLNRVLESIWMRREWSAFLMPNAFEITTVVGTRAYALPDYFGRMAGAQRIIRNITNGTEIYPISRNDLQARDPYQGTSSETSGNPQHYMLSGTSPVQTQPAAAGDALEVLSSSASDTTVRVFVEGTDTAGLVTQAQVTLTGTAAVAVGTFVTILKFGKAYPDGTDPTTEGTSSEGTVTLRKVTGAVSLQTLASWQDSRDHLTLVIAPTPDAVYTLALPIVRGVETMYRDADPLPPHWDNAVFDKMVRLWRVGDRDGANVDNAMDWPALVDLICFENAQMQSNWTSAPYGGR